MCQVLEADDNLIHLALRQFVGCEHWRAVRSQSELGCASNSPAPVLLLDTPESVTSDLKRQGYTYRHHFVVLPSRKEPRWLLPLGNPYWMRSSTQVYAPYSRPARAVKALL